MRLPGDAVLARSNDKPKTEEKIMRTTQSQEKLEIKIRRPNGEIETIIHPNDNIFAQMKTAAAAAGNGNPLSYETVTVDIAMTLSEQRAHLCSSINCTLRDERLTRR